MIRFTTQALLLFFISFFPAITNGQIQLSGTALSGGDFDQGTLYTMDEQGNTSLLHSFRLGPQFPTVNNGFTASSDGKLYALTGRGGRDNNGTIIRYNTEEDTLETVHGMKEGNIIPVPAKYLEHASNGLYYGVSYDGSNTNGNIFSYDANTGEITILHAFQRNDNNGMRPNAAPLIVNDTVLYGTTTDGGVHNQGVLFRYDITNNIFYKLTDFNGSALGERPEGQLTLASDGYLYGTTSFGGINNDGTIFRHNLTNAETEKVADFDKDVSGEHPVSKLVEVNGYLIGTCENGGVNEKGTIFSYNLSAEELHPLLSFSTPEGPAHPRSRVTKGAGNTFYFVSTKGGTHNNGVLAKYDLSTGDLTSLHDFGDHEDGRRPQSKLHIDEEGVIYGMTTEGGRYNRGIVFRYDTTTSTYEKKWDFEGNYFGSRPKRELIYNDHQEKIYGFADGGHYNEGILFSADPSTNEYGIAHHFSYVTDGASPLGRTVKGREGQLYGVCSSGGENEAGTLWMYSPDTDDVDVLHHFTEAEGSRHQAGLTFNVDSTVLVGIARRGGENNDGTLYAYSLESNTLTVLHSFNTSAEGWGNESHLLLANNGLFYGMTFFGGTNNRGVIYALSLEDSTFTTVYNFESNSGVSRNSFTQGNGSTLYTMVQANNGQLIAFDYETATIDVLWQSGSNRPRNPLGNVFLAPDGETLIGTFSDGPGNNGGQAFAYYLPRNNYRVIKNFTGDYGADIRGSLTYWGDCPAPQLATTFSQWHETDTIQLCYGSGQLVVTNEIHGVTNHLWSRGNNFLGFQDTTQYTLNTENNINGRYTIKANNACGNVFDTIYVDVARLDTSVNVEEERMIANENNSSVSYQWYNCDNEFIISGADGRIFEPEKNGSYGVALTHEYGCTDSSFCKTFSISGLEKLSLMGDISVYPTQFHQSINVELPAHLQGVEATLRSTTGQDAYGNSHILSPGNNTLNFGNVKPGIYLFTLNADGQQVTYKVIKK